MQVAPGVTRNCPFVEESDTLSLSSGFRLHVSSGFLEDKIVGVAHRIQPQAADILKYLQTGGSVNKMRRRAARVGVHDSQLAELLGFLNIIGGLQRTRHLRVWPRALFMLLRQLAFGIYYSPLAWRREARATYLLYGILRACATLVVAAGVLAAFAAAAGVVTPLRAAMFFGFGLVLFLFSLFVHEWAHVVIIRRCGAPAVVLQKGLRLGILHRRLPAVAEIYSALAGPAAGVLTGAAAAAAVLPYSSAFSLLALLIGTFHFGGLLPWYGDGMSLRAALRRKGAQSEATT